MQLKKKRIGLALGSGGPRGLAHIGVIKALKESGIPIDVIAGSSAGALIGGVYIAMGSIQTLEEYVNAITYKDLAWMFLDLGSISGIIRGDKIEEYLERTLSGITIESLPIPFAAVATDLSTGEAVILKTGLLSHAIRASSSIPALIDAAHIGNRHLVDGGASLPIPVPTVKEIGADYCIAVNLDTYPFIKSDESERSPTIPDMGFAAIQLLRYNLAHLLCLGADTVITPDVSRVSTVNLIQILHGEEIIRKGYDATRTIIPKIKSDLGI